MNLIQPAAGHHFKLQQTRHDCGDGYNIESGTGKDTNLGERVFMTIKTRSSTIHVYIYIKAATYRLQLPIFC